ncbi:MAG: alpha/beta hydrolase-fold protein [Thermoanaerobaculaceae bacterium]
MRPVAGALAGGLMAATVSWGVAAGERTVRLTLVVTRVPASTPADDALFVASNVHGWKPAPAAGRLARTDDGTWVVRLAVPPGARVEYKLTRGSWETVEKGPRGEERPNRTVQVAAEDVEVRLTVPAWADQVSPAPVRRTVSGDVTVVDAFPAPELGGSRRLWIYLPPGYAGGERRYPVLYMHDGQNLFDVSTSFAGEWEVDESLDALAREGRLEGLIVVGIDNAGDARLDEYSPWRDRQLGRGGRGDVYASFLVRTLKPYVDRTWRTLPGRDHTGVAGSSMGGLISLYAGLRYPEVFGRVGVLSPTLGFAARMPMRYVRTARARLPQRVYVDMGGAESGHPAHDRELVELARTAASTLEAGGFEVRLVVDAAARHHESAWAARFPEAVTWMFRP